MSAQTMSKAEREEFLAGVHVGIVAVGVEGGAPVTAPVWYRYEPGGEICFNTDESSLKVQALRKAGRATFVVQTETAPYTYVAVEGAVSFRKPDWERDSVTIAKRYLGERGGEAYLASTGGEAGRGGSVLVAITPEKWRTVDYRKTMR